MTVNQYHFFFDFLGKTKHQKSSKKDYPGLCSCTLLAMHEGLLVATVPVQVRVWACFKGHNLMILPRRWLRFNQVEPIDIRCDVIVHRIALQYKLFITSDCHRQTSFKRAYFLE